MVQRINVGLGLFLVEESNSRGDDVGIGVFSKINRSIVFKKKDERSKGLDFCASKVVSSFTNNELCKDLIRDLWGSHVAWGNRKLVLM